MPVTHTGALTRKMRQAQGRQALQEAMATYAYRLRAQSPKGPL
jgi:hypothetical protein